MAITRERSQVVDELNKVKKLQANFENLKDSANDIQKLAKRLGKKIFEMPVAEKKKLLDYFIPPGQEIEIFPFYPSAEEGEEERFIRLPNIKRKIKVSWEWTFRGIIDVQKVVAVLWEYDKTGAIPEYHKFHDINSANQSTLKHAI